jgi:pyruvate/2-oxoglutarate dehydrogenase complex dihydrolipoamide dehydrogenase (E3) component
VGIDEQQAQRQGIPVTVFRHDFQHLDRAILDGETEGFVKVIAKARTGRILGATVVARRAGDLIAELTLAMTNRLGLRAISKTIHPYPTHAEAIKRVGDAFNRSRLTPFFKSLFDRWMAWTR